MVEPGDRIYASEFDALSDQVIHRLSIIICAAALFTILQLPLHNLHSGKRPCVAIAPAVPYAEYPS